MCLLYKNIIVIYFYEWKRGDNRIIVNQLRILIVKMIYSCKREWKEIKKHIFRIQRKGSVLKNSTNLIHSHRILQLFSLMHKTQNYLKTHRVDPESVSSLSKWISLIMIIWEYSLLNYIGTSHHIIVVWSFSEKHHLTNKHYPHFIPPQHNTIVHKKKSLENYKYSQNIIKEILQPFNSYAPYWASPEQSCKPSSS